MRAWIALASAFAALFTAREAFALEVCINGPSSYGGSIDATAVDAVIALHPRCVRLGFRQDIWNAPDDPTPRGPSNQAILPMFDAVVARYEAAGIAVHMLVHTESLNLDAHAPGSIAGRASFVAGAVKIIDHFKPHVRRFELYNEPNNWDSTQQPVLSADSFAATLGDTYSAVKGAHPNDACWDVDLVSGALFAFHRSNGEGTSAADYLAQTYAAGITSHGWDAIKQKTGSYPLDGIGWHLYMESTDAAATAGQVDAYVGELWNVASSHEGASSPKKIWISELGFGTNDSASENDAQAAGLDHVFDALAGAPHVAMGMWFTFQDFDSAGWGLYRSGAFDDAHARPSRSRFVAQAKAKVEPLWSKVAFVSAPKSIVAGAKATLSVVATNLGSEAWTEADHVRLGAGPGCPTTPAANALRWTPALGYANGPTDARAFLAAGDTVAGAATHAFTFDVVAPVTPGTYAVSARMVKENVAWFGTPAAIAIEVVAAAPPSADAGGAAGDAGGARLGDAGDGDSSAGSAAAPGDGGAAATSGCGCASAGHEVDARAALVASPAALALLLALRLRRERRSHRTMGARKGRRPRMVGRA